MCMSDQLFLPLGFKQLTFNFIKEYADAPADEKPAGASAPVADRSGMFVPWPDYFREPGAVDYHKGDAPGEYWVAELFGAEKPQGPYSTFDVAAADGTKWEVKEPDKSGVFKGGTLSTQATAGMRESVRRVASQLAELEGNIDLTDADPELAAAVDDFLTREKAGYRSIKRDEITLGAAARLVEILKRLKKFSASGDARVQIDVGDGRSEGTVSRGTALRIAQLAGLDMGSLGAAPITAAVSTIDPGALEDPEGWIKNLLNSDKIVEETFGHVDGVVLVSPAGYMVVPKGETAKAFEFWGTTQARARFKVREGYKLPR